MTDTADEQLDQTRALIRKAGLRATTGRIAVLTELLEANGPLTHAEVFQRVAKHGADSSTIFRALNDMANSGLLRRMELGDHAWRYEIAGSHQTGNAPHSHFLCLKCGDILCIDAVEVKTQPLKKGKIHQVTEVLLKGECGECQ